MRKLQAWGGAAALLAALLLGGCARQDTVTATPEQAEEVCEHIRAVIRKLYGAKIARAISILYGGSMNEKNAYDLLAQPDIDGGLIGGASLVPEKFVKIIEAANQPTI